MMTKLLTFLALTSVTSAFLLPHGPTRSMPWSTTVVSSSEQSDEEPPSLIQGDELEQQMARLRSKYPTSESAYLAAARARNQARTESRDQTATDDEWQAISQQAQGAPDGWEEAAKEADNGDNQILIPVEEGGDGDDEEPKLMLF